MSQKIKSKPVVVVALYPGMRLGGGLIRQLFSKDGKLVLSTRTSVSTVDSLDKLGPGKAFIGQIDLKNLAKIDIKDLRVVIISTTQSNLVDGYSVPSNEFLFLPEKSVVIKFEELLSEPEKSISKIRSMISLSFSPKHFSDVLVSRADRMIEAIKGS